MLKKIKSFLLNKFFQNYIWLAIAEITSKGINILLPILIVRYIGLEDFGVYSLAFSLGIIFFVLSDIGFTQLFIREIAKNNKNISLLFSKFFTSKLVFTFLNFILLIFIYLLLPGKTGLLIILLGLIYISNGFIEFIRAIFRGLEKSKYEAYIRISYSIILLSILIPYIALFNGNIIGLNIIYLFINIIFGVLLYLYIYRINIINNFFYNITKKEIFSYLKTSYPFALSTIIVMLYYYIDTIILKFYVGYTEVGIYSSAYRIILVLIAPISILVNALFPTLSKLYKNNLDLFKGKVKKITFFIFILNIFIFPLIMYFADYISYIFYGDILQDNTLLIQILFSSVFFLYLGSIFGVALQTSNEQKKYMKISAIGLIINIILNIILIPIYGINGAAIATMITEIIILSGYYFYFQKIHKK